jgi:cob(I)alamin adenosyltransferase
MKTFNKKGDSGETSLLSGCRVPKDSLRCEAYGTIDEAVSCLGIARNATTKKKTKEIIFKVQQELFRVGSELALRPEDAEKFKTQITPVTVEIANQLEELINCLESEVQLPRSFIIPGATAGSAALDLARSIIRRAERRVVTLTRNKEINNPAISSYLNRLADLLFILARWEEKE